jgi:hypothetical protein
MKSLIVLLSTSVVLGSAMVVAGQSLHLVSVGAVLFAASVVGFAFADYTRQPRLALRPLTALRTVARAVRPARGARESVVAALARTASPFQTMSA